MWSSAGRPSNAAELDGDLLATWHKDRLINSSTMWG
jgi:hypothetical protein